jgi:hypothetical protein
MDQLQRRAKTSAANAAAAPWLDVREQHFRIPGPRQGMSLFLRLLPAAGAVRQPGRSVLYVHGATFPPRFRSPIDSTAGPGATRFAQQASTSGAWISTASAIPTAIRT